MTESTATKTEENTPLWWAPILEFLIHAIVGTILFILIALPAIGLNLLIHLFQTELALNPLVILSFTLVEYAILSSDLFLFAVFIVRSTSRTMKLL